MPLILALSTNLKAQSREYDNNWELNTNKSDEFDSFNSSLWQKCNSPLSDCGWGSGEGYDVDTAYVLVENGKLKLILDEDQYGVLNAGQIQTINDQYLYGYYEIYSKCLSPGNYKDNEPYTPGFKPTFWTYYVYEDPPGCRVVHDEIDILELTFGEIENSDHAVKVHDENGNCGHYAAGYFTLSDTPPLFDNWHKYAVEFLPDRIIFYFNDEPFYFYYNTSVFSENEMKVVLAIGAKMDYFDRPNTVLPQSQIVEYFRFYDLVMDYCNNDVEIIDNDDLDDFTWGVYKSITIGDGSSSITLDNNDTITFRATDNITINSEFAAPLGSELNLVPTPCY